MVTHTGYIIYYSGYIVYNVSLAINYQIYLIIEFIHNVLTMQKGQPCNKIRLTSGSQDRWYNQVICKLIPRDGSQVTNHNTELIHVMAQNAELHVM